MSTQVKFTVSFFNKTWNLCCYLLVFSITTTDESKWVSFYKIKHPLLVFFIELGEVVHVVKIEKQYE